MAKGETILVVEDDEDVWDFTRTALISLGYRVYEVSDAISGLEMLAEHPQISLLLSDVGLPGMNGRRLEALYDSGAWPEGAPSARIIRPVWLEEPPRREGVG